MKKVFSLMMAAMFAITLMACGDKDGNSSSNNSGDNNGQVVEPQDKSLENTTWRYRFDESDGYTVYELSFQAGSQCKYNIVGYDENGNEDSSLTDRYTGTYTYDGYRGTLKMKKASGSSSTTYDGTFRVEDDYLQVEFREERIDLTKVQ